jgi:diadenylate cyclase
VGAEKMTDNKKYWVWLSLALGPSTRNDAILSAFPDPEKLYFSSEAEKMVTGVFTKRQLEKIGNAPISNIKHMSSDTKSVSYISNAISVITETACDLSLEKTGALIVIERETKLGEHIKTGTIINAQLSSQILKNIFYNKAPLHDGAVILRNYRVFSAGCFLPLSLNEEIDENMGTRHRAAIGISEVSDAVVVVVSEETGKISIVHDGKLKQNYSYKSLQKELSNLLLPNTNEKDSKKSKLRRKFMKKGDNNE